MIVQHLKIPTLVIALSLFASACSESSSSSTNAGVPDQDQAQVIVASTQTVPAAAQLTLGATLNQIDPTNFPPLQSPPTAMVTGNASAGTVNLDFGAGTTVNNATFAGTLQSTYTVTGNDVSITVDLTGLTIITTSAGSVDAAGTLTIVATLNGTAMITSTITGTVTLTNPTQTVTVTPNLTVTLDGQTSLATANGTSGIDHNMLGVWTANFNNIVASQALSAMRSINSGVLSLTRQTAPSLTAEFTFTGANSGDLVVSPLGLTISFVL
jgi:hypothetical protein